MNLNTLKYSQVAIGDKLPELKIDITSGLIIGAPRAISPRCTMTRKSHKPPACRTSS